MSDTLSDEQMFIQQLQLRTTGIQQVTSRFPVVFRQPKHLLKSHEYYHECNMNINSQLTQYGLGLSQYFLTGDLSLPSDINMNEPVVANLTSTLESAIMEIMGICIDPVLSAQYMFENYTAGSGLLREIRSDCADPNRRQLFQLIKEITYWSAAGCNTMEPRIGACLRKMVFLSDKHPFVNKVAGLLYIMMMKNPQAESRALDVLDRNLTPSEAIMKAVVDLKPSVKTVPDADAPLTALLAEVKSGNKPKAIICHNCKGKGHRKNVCPSKQVAKAPTAYSAVRTVNDNSGIAWVSKAGVHGGFDGYVIDSGANVHVTHNKDHLRDWEAAAGELTGVGIGSLPIHGKGTVVFVHPETEDQMVVKNVLYVPDIAQNLISSKYFTANGGKIMFNSDSVWHAASNSTEMIKVGTLNNTLYSFDLTIR